MHDVAYAMHVNIIMFIKSLYNIYTYLEPLFMNFIKKLYTYKHDIDMHMRHHADFKIFY